MSFLVRFRELLAGIISAAMFVVLFGGGTPAASAIGVSESVATSNFTVSWDPATLVVPEAWFSGTVRFPIHWQTTQTCVSPATENVSLEKAESSFKSVMTIERTMTLTFLDSSGTALATKTWGGTPYCSGTTEMSFPAILLYGDSAQSSYSFRLDFHWAYNMLDGYGVRHTRTSANATSNLILPPVPQLGGAWVIKQNAGTKKRVTVGWAYLNLITREDATYVCQISKKNSQIVFLPATYSDSATCNYRLPKKAKFVIRAWAETSIGTSPVLTFNVRT